MEPFSIVCKSCAARLNVTKASAVGQILACPKCGTMIEVKPPPGWTPPEPLESNSEQSGSLDSNLAPSNRDPHRPDSQEELGSHFEDIDSILSPPVKPSPNPPRKLTAEIHTKRSQIEARKKHAATVNPTGPVLPTDQWTSDSTKKRKRIAIWAIGSIGSLALLAAIVTSVLINRNKQTADHADRPDTSTESAIPDAEPGIDDNEPNDGILTDGPPTEPKPGITDVPLDPAVEIGDSPPPVLSNDALSPPPIDGEPKEMAGDDSPHDAKSTPQAKDVSPFARQSPFGPGSTTPDVALPGGANAPTRPPEIATGITNQLGDLSALLEQRGTSLRDIKDAVASRQSRHVIGLPKYVIKYPRAQKIDLERKLDWPIGGILYESAVPLVGVLRKLTTISGIPITVDARAIVMAGKSPNPEITLKITDTNFEDTVTQILTKAGLSTTKVTNGLIIGAATSNTLSESKYDFPDVPSLDEKDKQHLIGVIKTLVNPRTWAREQNQPTLNLNGNQIIANCSSSSHRQIDDLLTKLAACAALIQDPNDADSLKKTESRWNAIDANLSKDPGLSHSAQTTVGFFLDRCYSATGVTVLMDWDHLMSEGWSPLTLIPGNLNEPTLHDVLEELEQSMNLVALAVDSQTMVMTTNDQATTRLDLEVYSVSKLLAGPLDENKMKDLILQTLGGQLQSENVRFIYEPDFQCLIVFAPQALQRQLASLLKQLESI